MLSRNKMPLQAVASIAKEMRNKAPQLPDIVARLVELIEEEGNNRAAKDKNFSSAFRATPSNKREAPESQPREQ